MKVLICGSRGWHDPEPIRIALATLADLAAKQDEKLIVVHGHAPKGADRLADQLARAMGYGVIREPAEWDRLGKAAGFVRNQRMLDSHPDIDTVYAFRASGKSNGTDDMIKRARTAGKRVLVIHP